MERDFWHSPSSRLQKMIYTPKLETAMDKKTKELLVSPIFLIALALLLLNDFIFKETFHNFITGKLSDVCGLFIFPIFFSVFYPAKKLRIYALTLLLFIYWKSTYSQTFINIFNELSFFKIARTVDYTDLLALSILPVSYKYFNEKGKKLYLRNKLPKFVSLVCLFSFIATVEQNEFNYNKEYKIHMTKSELLDQIKNAEDKGAKFKLALSYSQTGSQNNYYLVIMGSQNCQDTIGYVYITENSNKSLIKLEKFSYSPDCMKVSDINAKTLDLFEKEFIYKIATASSH